MSGDRMPILRLVVDVHTDDAPDARKAAEVVEGVRDYLRAVLLPQVGMTYDKEAFGEGTPRWAHWHESRIDIDGFSDDPAEAWSEGHVCGSCIEHAADAMNRQSVPTGS